jgi:hypothetical protein
LVQHLRYAFLTVKVRTFLRRQMVRTNCVVAACCDAAFSLASQYNLFGHANCFT